MEDLRKLDLVRMATYIFCEACNHSHSGNWQVDIDEVEHIFGIKITKEIYCAVSDELRENFSLQVLDLNVNDDEYYYDNESYWDITIGGYYTMYGDDDYDDEPIEQEKITSSDVKTKQELLTELAKLQGTMEKEVIECNKNQAYEDVWYNKGYIQAIWYISQQIKKLEVK